jgi:hypothetical protein
VGWRREGHAANYVNVADLVGFGDAVLNLVDDAALY